MTDKNYEQFQELLKTLSQSEFRQFKLLSICYRRMAVPVILETLQLFIESENKQGMLEEAEKWALRMR
jgi:hypothetical protein